jgi:hypothetical protein
MGMMTDGPKYKRPTLDGYYVPTNLGKIGRDTINAKLLKLKGSPQRRRDDSEPFFIVT